eukprot:gene8425-5905_t
MLHDVVIPKGSRRSNIEYCVWAPNFSLNLEIDKAVGLNETFCSPLHLFLYFSIRPLSDKAALFPLH